MAKKLKVKSQDQRKIEALETENITLMLSLTEEYEKGLQREQDNLNTMMALTDLYEQVNGGV